MTTTGLSETEEQDGPAGLDLRQRPAATDAGSRGATWANRPPKPAARAERQEPPGTGRTAAEQRGDAQQREHTPDHPETDQKDEGAGRGREEEGQQSNPEAGAAPIHPDALAGREETCATETDAPELTAADSEVLQIVEEWVGGEETGYDVGRAEENGDAGAPPVSAVLGRRTVDALLERHPVLRDAAHRALFLHSLFSTELRKSRDGAGREYVRVAVPYGRLATLEGRADAAVSKVYRGWEFLERHRASFPDFDFTGWQRPDATAPAKERRKGWPRQIRHHGVPLRDLAAIEADLHTPLCDLDEPVDVMTLERVDLGGTGRAAVARKETERARRAAAERAAQGALCAAQQLLLRVLNGQKSNRFTRRLRENAAAAIAAASAIPNGAGRLRALMGLRIAQLYPQPLYGPSARRRTVRVFAVGRSVLGLPKAVRRALHAGLLAFDLVNAQLAVVAVSWDVALLRAHLVEHGSVWPLLLALVGGEHRLAGPDEVKGALKRAVYAIAFGMSEAGVRWLLTTALSAGAARRVLDHPVVRALLLQRDEALRRIDAEGGGVDCFGVRYRVVAPPAKVKRRAREVRSVLASLAQARELWLLMPVVVEAEREGRKRRPAFSIAAWLHDGFVVAVDARRRGQVERRLKQLVSARAEVFDVPTQLDAELLVGRIDVRPAPEAEVSERPIAGRDGGAAHASRRATGTSRGRRLQACEVPAEADRPDVGAVADGPAEPVRVMVQQAAARRATLGERRVRRQVDEGGPRGAARVRKAVEKARDHYWNVLMQLCDPVDPWSPGPPRPLGREEAAQMRAEKERSAREHERVSAAFARKMARIIEKGPGGTSVQPRSASWCGSSSTSSRSGSATAAAYARRSTRLSKRR